MSLLTTCSRFDQVSSFSKPESARPERSAARVAAVPCAPISSLKPTSAGDAGCEEEQFLFKSAYHFVVDGFCGGAILTERCQVALMRWESAF